MTSPNQSSRHLPHPTKKVRVGASEANIDVKIVPLIRLLWQSGIETSMSCQGYEDEYIWIEFPSENDLVLFLDAVGKYERGQDCLYNRMSHWLRTSVDAQDWMYSIDVLDTALDLDADNETSAPHAGFCSFMVFFSVRFPQKDLDVVVRRMRTHVRMVRRLVESKSSGSSADLLWLSTDAPAWLQRASKLLKVRKGGPAKRVAS